MVPGSRPHWLNQQPHPHIRYTSILHLQAGDAGDGLVQACSQNLNQVPSLRGRTHLNRLQTVHSLSPADGQAILPTLNKRK